MPPVVIAAGISAVSALAASKMASSAQGKATKAQTQATSEALTFSKQQEADRKAAYEKSMGLYEQQWNAREAAREALLKRYGFDIGSSGAVPGKPGAMPPGAVSAAPMGAGVGGPAGGAGAASTPAGPMTGATLGDIATRSRPEWNDWSRYGLRTS